jgi:hypothetical protein
LPVLRSSSNTPPVLVPTSTGWLTLPWWIAMKKAVDDCANTPVGEPVTPWKAWTRPGPSSVTNMSQL